MGLPGVGIIFERVGAQRVDDEMKDLGVVVPAGVLDRAPCDQEQALRVLGLAFVVVADEPAIGFVGFHQPPRLRINDPPAPIVPADCPARPAAPCSANFSASANCPRRKCNSARRASSRGSLGARPARRRSFFPPLPRRRSLAAPGSDRWPRRRDPPWQRRHAGKPRSPPHSGPWRHEFAPGPEARRHPPPPPTANPGRESAQEQSAAPKRSRTRVDVGTVLPSRKWITRERMSAGPPSHGGGRVTVMLGSRLHGHWPLASSIRAGGRGLSNGPAWAIPDGRRGPSSDQLVTEPRQSRSGRPRTEKPRVSKFETRGFVGSNLSRDCDGGVASRRAGIGACLALPLVDPGPRYGFGTSVGTVIREVCIGPCLSAKPSRPRQIALGRHFSVRQGCLALAVATAGRHNDRQFGGPAVEEIRKFSGRLVCGLRRSSSGTPDPHPKRHNPSALKNLWLASSKNPADQACTRIVLMRLSFGEVRRRGNFTTIPGRPSSRPRHELTCRSILPPKKGHRG